VRVKETPQNVSCRNSRIQTKIGVVRELTGNVHRDRVPSVYPSDQLVKFHFCVSTAILGIVFYRRADVSQTVTQ
jgi:hypothetical protein